MAKVNYLERSYILQRRGMCLLAALLPVALFLSSTVLHRMPFQTSISAYYWTLDPERNLLVGVLVSISAFLVLYKGRSRWEDRLLDIAGISAAGIAFFPTARDGDSSAAGISAHGVFAVIFFACIAIVCIFEPKQADQQGPAGDTERHAQFRRLYRWCSGVMTATVAGAVVSRFLPKAWTQALREGHLIFVLETLAIWSFSAYWYIKTREYDPGLRWIPMMRRPVAPEGDSAGV